MQLQRRRDTGPRLSPYAGEFVPTGHKEPPTSTTRQRRGSDPSTNVDLPLGRMPTKENPRLAYQFSPGSSPRAPNEQPHLSSPAAALRMVVYERLGAVVSHRLTRGQNPAGMHAPEVGSQAHSNSILSGPNTAELDTAVMDRIREGDRRVHSDIIHTFAKEVSRRDAGKIGQYGVHFPRSQYPIQSTRCQTYQVKI